MRFSISIAKSPLPLWWARPPAEAAEAMVRVLRAAGYEPRLILPLSLSYDHRLIDGALADQFTNKVKAVLESWSDEVL